jgi:tRNA nucleotidyltransferase (CCA-adding enzyme)
MAIALNHARFGELIDYFGAQRDIKEKRIRILHSLSFVEDPSRILRAVRFEQRFGFSLGKQTLDLIHSAIQSGLLKDVPGGRIFHEFKQILLEDSPIKGLDRLKNLGVLKAIHPGLDYGQAIKEILVQAEGIISWFKLLYTQEVISPWFIFFLALIDHMEQDVFASICERLGMIPMEMNSLVESKKKILGILKEFAKKGEIKPSKVVDILGDASLEEVLFVMAKTKSPEIKKMVSSHITNWRHYNPPVKGGDLIALGFKEGRSLGDCLRIIRQKGLDGEIKNASEALSLAKMFLKGKKT